MFRHNVLFFFRNALRSKTSFSINLIGLSIGLTCTLLIYLWVQDELSTDKFHEKGRQLFQVMKNASYSGKEITTYEATPGRLAKALADEMPEVQYAVSVNAWSSKQSIISVGNKHIKAQELYAEKDFFAMFSYPLLHGNKALVLNDRRGVAISDGLAKKLFNSTESIVGKTIEWKQGDAIEVFQITGVFEKPPVNSTQQFDIVLSFDVLRNRSPEIDEWFNGGGVTYLLLKEGTNLSQFNSKISSFLQGKSGDALIGNLFVRPYSDKYLYDKYENGVQIGGRIQYVRLFSITAIFILLIACINFMNLFTAKVSGRLKQVGVRKTLGASRKKLIYQFLGEALSMAFLSLSLANFFIVLLLPYFNQITGKQLTLQPDVNFVLSNLLIAVGTGLIAGSYPAVYLSGFNPITVLKGKLVTSPGEIWARKGLVIFQFTISIIFILSVIVVYKQIQLIQTKNLGYNRDNVIVFKKEGKLNDSFDNFLHELKSIPGVINASSTGGNMTSADNTTDALQWKGKDPDDRITFASLQVNYDFLETLNIELKEGRAFSREYGSDSSKIIFTEAAIAAMNMKDPVGKTVTLDGKEMQIIGIARNIHFESLHNKMKPAFFLLRPNTDNIMVKIKAVSSNATIGQIENLYQKFNQGLPFEYSFLDEVYQKLYTSEQRVAVLSRYFSVISIFISCLGLFGLAAFTAERRRKEIGVRKVLGARVSQIALLLSKDFLLLVIVAICIGFPIALWATNNWLQDFAYKADISVWLYIVAAIAAIMIALLTVSFQAIKAAVANPVKSLRPE
jgi:putative ABC transport system permease protein